MIMGDGGRYCCYNCCSIIIIIVIIIIVVVVDYDDIITIVSYLGVSDVIILFLSKKQLLI